jgi:hypothetical protein
VERELGPLLYPLLREAAKDFQQRHVRYQPWLLVTVLLGAARHDRSIAGACQGRHWHTTSSNPPRGRRPRRGAGGSTASPSACLGTPWNNVCMAVVFRPWWPT